MNHQKFRSYALLIGALCIAVGGLAAGCNDDKQASGDAPYGQAAAASPAAPANAPADPTAAAQPPAGGPAGAMSAPPLSGAAGGGTAAMPDNPDAPLTPSPVLDKAIAAATAKGDNKAIAQAYADRGFERMTDDAAGRKVKYRAALDDFREALKKDPTNAKAKENKDMIEKIYKQMGRPIPGMEDPTAKP